VPQKRNRLVARPGIRLAVAFAVVGAFFPVRLGLADRAAIHGAKAKLPPSKASADDLFDAHIHLAKGDTLVSLLAEQGLSTPEAYAWSKAASKAFDVRRMRPRRGLTLRFESDTRKLRALRYEIDDRTLLVVESKGGKLDARREDLPYITEIRGIAGTIDHGLWQDVTEAGAPGEVASALSEVFGWEFDLDALQGGGQFRVLYENIWQVGAKRPSIGKVLAASLDSGGKSVTALLHEDEDGHGGYYTADGRALGRYFLRYPVEFTKISSTFSARRFHPILGRTRPHNGVDFAAPRGTPVYAVADGKVLFASWERGFGRTVRIEHEDGYRTTYGHLSGYAGRVGVGRTVRRGQVIGYVGSTGLSTGNHLHYGVECYGQYVDPLALKSLGTSTVPADERRTFDRMRRRVTQQLALLEANRGPVVVSQRRAE
jgi:murein DD-endopeptidase MepM/ murein hydrolase activator NlpD